MFLLFILCIFIGFVVYYVCCYVVVYGCVLECIGRGCLIYIKTININKKYITAIHLQLYVIY